MDIRESLEAAVEAVEAKTPAPEAPAPSAEPTPAAEAPAPEAKPVEAATKEAPKESAPGRDESGRFTKQPAEKGKKAEKGPAPELAEAKPSAKPEAQKQEAALEEKESAPTSWKPLERDAFFKAPPEVRAVILRREKEFQAALQDSARAKQTAQQVEQVLAPHASMFQADGVAPLQGIQSLLGMAQTLRSGTQANKAQLLAHLITSNGVDIQTLASALDSKAQPQQPRQLDPEALLQQAEQRVYQRLQTERGAAVNQRLQGELSNFGSTHEFFNDVREDMADLFQSAHRRGINLSMEDAYTRACQLHPEVSKVLKQREEAAAAQQSLAATQRTRAASTSLRPQPAGVTTPAPMGIRDALAAAAAKLGG